jgi:putative flippase GtrA
MTTAYLLNRHFVFAASGRGVASEYTRFALVNLAAVAQVWIVSVGLARLVFPAIGFTWHAETVAHVIGVAIPVFTSYLGHKHFSFAAKG